MFRYDGHPTVVWQTSSWCDLKQPALQGAFVGGEACHIAADWELADIQRSCFCQYCCVLHHTYTQTHFSSCRMTTTAYIKATCMYTFCMHVCVYVCVYACVYVCMYVCMYASMYVCMYVCMQVCMYVCMCVCMAWYVWYVWYVCMYVCFTVCTYVTVCMYAVCMYACMCVCAHEFRHPKMIGWPFGHSTALLQEC